MKPGWCGGEGREFVLGPTLPIAGWWGCTGELAHPGSCPARLQMSGRLHGSDERRDDDRDLRVRLLRTVPVVEWPTRRRLLVTWVVVAGVLLTTTMAARAGRSPLDDPDPARQRPGILDPARSAPLAPAAARAGLPQGGVVFFERPGRAARLCAALTTASFRRQTLVVSSAATRVACESLRVVDLAEPGALIGLPRPRDGGPASGYVIVDPAGRVRYRTLDPDAGQHLGEVATMLRAAG